MRVMIVFVLLFFLVRKRVRIKIWIRVRVRVGVTFNVRIFRRIEQLSSEQMSDFHILLCHSRFPHAMTYVFSWHSIKPTISQNPQTCSTYSAAWLMSIRIERQCVMCEEVQ